MMMCINKQVCNYVGPNKNPEPHCSDAGGLMDFIQSNDSFQNEIIILCLIWVVPFLLSILNSCPILSSLSRASTSILRSFPIDEYK
jgi:hypothetical protein